MQITMKESEFKEAIVCWLKEQGFDPEMYDMDMKIIPGRIHGTSVIVDLESKGSSYLMPREFAGISSTKVASVGSQSTIYTKGFNDTEAEPVYLNAVDTSVTLATTSPTTSTSLHFNSPSSEE